MEMRKLLLYFALGLVCFSLWIAWQKDHPTASATTPVAVQNKKPIVQSQTPTVANITVVPKYRLIRIKTDVLDLAVDTRGGNIVSASLLKYPLDQKNKNISVKILNSKPGKLYIAQSGLRGVQNNKQLQYTTVRKNYILATGGKSLQVKLRWQGKNGVKVTKIFTVEAGSYAVNIDYSINNKSANLIAGQQYNQIVRKKQKKTSGLFGLHTYTGAAVSSAKKLYEKISYSDMDKHDLNRTVHAGWVAMQQRYFLTAWIPNQKQTHYYYSQTKDGEIYTIGMSTPIKVAAGENKKIATKLYIGPEMAAYLKPLAKGLDLTIDYGWLWLLSVAVFWVMQHIFNIVGNWGWAIILVTILIKLVFYPFSQTSYLSMAKMRALAPKMKALKGRYGDDKQAMSKATMELYRKEHVNPLGGCLPMVIQIPVFIALYYVLIEAVQLRQAPFIFWIHDLSLHDPYYILPILMGVSMFFQQKLNPAPPDPTQAKVMMFLPVIFTAIFLAFPAGLVLYWLVNNILSILQQWYIMRRYEQGKFKQKAKK